MEKPWLKDFDEDVAKWRSKWEALYDEGVPAKPIYPDIPMKDLFKKCVEKFPEKTYLIWRDTTLTYKETYKMVCQLANALLDMGVQKGDRVAVMLPNVPAYVIAIHACFKIGAIEVPCNHLYTVTELKAQFKDCGAETVISIAPHAEKAIQTLDDADTPIKRVIAVQAPGYTKEIPSGENIFDFDQILQSAADTETDIEVLPTDIARLQYTGGTTGVPKGCVLTNAMIMTQAVRTSEWFRPGVPPVDFITLCAIPLNHIYAYNGNVLICMYEGGTIVLVDVPTPDNLLANISTHKPNIFAAVPAMIIGLINHPEISNTDISSLVGIFSGSAALAVNTLQKFEELTGGKIVEGYGMSETINVLTLNPMFRLRKFGSCGMVWPDTDLVVVDVETGTKVMPRGELGELIARGPQNITEYWEKPEETANAVTDGWLHTGDIVYMDEDGFIFIMDRKKDMIIVSGFNVYPKDIDEVMFKHPKVMEACTVGIPNEKQGESVKCFVVPKPGETMTQDEVIAFCREHLAPYKIPRFVEFIDAVPRTSVGKPDRKVLVAQEIAKQQSK
ncbi:MAG: long-chain fatty acid--CoA ligase [Bacillota bacterium]|nr:long-chain fatty acid--CoA ligase [Bacillota bacterium]